MIPRAYRCGAARPVPEHRRGYAHDLREFGGLPRWSGCFSRWGRCRADRRFLGAAERACRRGHVRRPATSQRCADCFRYLRAARALEVDPTSCSRARATPRVAVVLTRQEVDGCWTRRSRRAPRRRDAAMLYTMYASGLRVTELTTMRSRPARRAGPGSVVGKGGKQRLVRSATWRCPARALPALRATRRAKPSENRLFRDPARPAA